MSTRSLWAVVALSLLSCQKSTGPLPTGEAEQALEALRSSAAGRALLTPGVAHFEPQADHFRVLAGTKVETALPATADGVFTVQDVKSGATAAVRMLGAEPVQARFADGLALYAGAVQGADVVHRPTEQGTEDFLVFRSRPALELARYEVSFSSEVKGLRLIDGLLELLDEKGVPQLRMAPPYAVGADEKRRSIDVTVYGCDFDTNPAVPWGRPVVPPGSDHCTVEISWNLPASAYPAVVDPGWTLTDALAAPRFFETVVTMGSGDVLVACGAFATGAGANFAIVTTSEIYGATTGKWTGTAANAGCSYAAPGIWSPVLSRAVVFMANTLGAGPSNAVYNYNPATGMWAVMTGYTTAREFASVTQLQDGGVLIAGGQAPAAGRFNLGTLYNVVAQTSSPNFLIGGNRCCHASALLPDGRVMLAGGLNDTSTLASMIIFNTSNQAAAIGANLSVPREFPSAAVLPNGNVLIVGGDDAVVPTATFLTTVDQYNQVSNQLVAGTAQMKTGRARHGIITLPSGKVLVAGGESPQNTSTPTSEVYDPGTNAWTDGGLLTVGRRGTDFGLTGQGIVIMPGGATGGVPTGNLVTHGTVDAYELKDNGQSCSSNGQCKSVFCIDGVCCNTSCPNACDRCDLQGSVGTCAPAPAGNLGTPSCSPTVCNGTSVTCPPGCMNDLGCNPGFYCSMGVCLPKSGNDGGTCDAGDQCLTGVCAQGRCCDKACNGQCESCNLPMKVGTCTTAPAGSAGTPSCAPYLCNGTSTSCPPCVTDNDCVMGDFCDNGVCKPKGNNDGGTCDGGNQCATGFCSQGECCDRACTGGCEACNLTGSIGTCAFEPHGTAGTPACAPYVCLGDAGTCPGTCVTDSDCIAADTCMGGMCVPKGAGPCDAGSQCSSGHCAPQGVCCNSDCAGACEACNLNGTFGMCTTVMAGATGSPSCSPYLCNGTSNMCPNMCSFDSDCASGFYCDATSHMCTAKGTGSCTSGAMCTSGFCADGQCCDTACVGPCNACNLPGHLGACTNLAKDAVPEPDAGACGGFACSGGASCLSMCESDADCVAPATCQMGVCSTGTDGGATRGHVGFGCGCGAGAGGPLALALLALLRRRRFGGAR